MKDIPLDDGRVTVSRVGSLIELRLFSGARTVVDDGVQTTIPEGASQAVVKFSPDNSAALRLVLEQMEFAIAPGTEDDDDC